MQGASVADHFGDDEHHRAVKMVLEENRRAAVELHAEHAHGHGHGAAAAAAAAAVSRSCACMGSPCLRRCGHGASIGGLR
jgi:hypothetical protein